MNIPSGEEKREILRSYRGNLEYFIETGTAHGDTPMYLAGDFKTLYTIEIDRTLHDIARGRLESFPNIICYWGDSSDLLPKVLSECPGPALVWLDGHHSGPGTGRGTLDTPVVRELEVLFDDPRSNVILVDDARIFEEGREHELEPHYHDYPSLTWVREFATSNNYAYELADDIIRLTP